MSELYTRIERLCEENNTNVTELCRELKMPRSPLSELKAGRSKTLSSDKLVSIADYFNVSLDWLTGKSKYRNESEVIEYNWGYNNEYFTAAFDFCGLLKDIREKQEISVSDMAAVIGIEPQKYEECEEGFSPITEKQAEKLCEYLSVNIPQVLFDNELYDEPVPENYHSNVYEWEKLKERLELEGEHDANYEPAEDIKIVARHLEEIPSDKRDDLIKTINSTINMYRKAIGLDKKEN